jgi:hypothetical protein
MRVARPVSRVIATAPWSALGYASGSWEGAINPLFDAAGVHNVWFGDSVELRLSFIQDSSQ